MAKSQVKSKPSTAAAKSSASSKGSGSSKGAAAAMPASLFGKENYILFFGGIALIALGFLLMSGGATTDPNVFPRAELYSTIRITLAPLLVLAGFGVEIYAIMKKRA